MINAEAGQTSDGVSLFQLLQADRTLSCVLGEDILCKTAKMSHHIMLPQITIHQFMVVVNQF